MTTFAEVKAAAAGKWEGITSSLCGAGRLDEALKGRGRKHVECPVHGTNEKPPFRIFKDFAESGGVICSQCGPKSDGISTVAWLNGCDAVTAKNDIADYLGLNKDWKPRNSRSDQSASPHAVSEAAPSAPAAPMDDDDDCVSQAPPVAREPKVRTALLAKITQVFKEALCLTDPAAAPARMYLANRGLRILDELPISTLRYHPSMPYFESDNDGKMVQTSAHPCLLAAVIRPNGKVATLHRTYITLDGMKAPVPDPKKLMAGVTDESITGSFIPLYRATASLCVTEGIETALAVRSATRLPVWACVSASMLAGVEIPESVKNVFIWSDLDKSGAGAEASAKLAARLMNRGINVITVMPQGPIPVGKKGVDWLDVLNEQGSRAFPYAQTIAPPPQIRNRTSGGLV